MPLYVGHKNSGFKAVGNLTENNGVYSGFYAGSDLASSGYLQASQKLPNKISSFYFYTKFTWTGAGSSILSSVQDWKGLADIAIAKCCLMKGGEPNIDKAASMLIDDFRSLRLGKVTLEQPPQSEEE